MVTYFEMKKTHLLSRIFLKNFVCAKRSCGVNKGIGFQTARPKNLSKDTFRSSYSIVEKLWYKNPDWNHWNHPAVFLCIRITMNVNLFAKELLRGFSNCWITQKGNFYAWFCHLSVQSKQECVIRFGTEKSNQHTHVESDCTAVQIIIIYAVGLLCTCKYIGVDIKTLKLLSTSIISERKKNGISNVR